MLVDSGRRHPNRLGIVETSAVDNVDVGDVLAVHEQVH